MTENAQFLKTVTLFSTLESPDLEILATHFKLKQFPTDADVIREGESSEEFFIIRSGNARITRGLGEKKIMITSLGAGEYFGEAALFNQVKRTANVEALDYLEVLAITRTEFERFLDAHPVAARIVLHQMLKLLFFRLQKTSSELEFERQGGFAQDAIHKILN